MKTSLTLEVTLIAQKLGTSPDEITSFIEREWIQPIDPEGQMLDEDDIDRLRLIIELKKEFGVNDESLPIILHLIDQLHYIHYS